MITLISDRIDSQKRKKNILNQWAKLTLKQLEMEKWTKPKLSRMKNTIKVTAEISEIEN